MNRFIKISLKVILWIIGVVIGLLLLVFFLIRIPAVQNYAVQKVVSYLETKIKTPVQLARVSINLPKVLVLEGIYFEDQQGDTLIAGDTLRVDISLLKILANKVEINELDFRGITANINRKLPDSAYNFDYIIRAFTTEQVEEVSQDTTATMAFSIDKINLDRINLHYYDDIAGTSADFFLNHLDTRIKTFDLEKMFFEIPNLQISGIRTGVKQWQVAKSEDIPSTDDLGVEAAAGAEAASPDVRIGILDLKDFNIAYNDAGMALDAQVVFKKLLVDFNELNLPQAKIDIDKIELEDHFSRISFGKAANAELVDSTATDTDVAMNWTVQAGTLLLKNNHIQYDDFSETPIKDGLDYSHVDVDGLDVDLRQFFFATDSIRGNLHALRFKEKSGLEVKRLETDFTYSDTQVSLSDLWLETPHTLLKNHVTARYPSIEALTNDMSTLFIEADLEESRLGMRDVLLIMPDLATIEVVRPLTTRTFYIDAQVKGYLNDLSIPKLNLRTLDQTRLSVTGRIRGLPDIDRLYADIQIKNVQSSKQDLDRLIATSLLPAGIEFPKALRLNGTFKGSASRFNTDMRFRSTMGDADVRASYTAGRDTVYNAQLRVAGLNIGNLLGDTTYGEITVHADVKGRGLDPKHASAVVDGTLVKAYYNGYNYHDIMLKGSANQGDIYAKLYSGDPNLAINLTAHADMRGQYPRLSMDLMVDSVDLQALRFSNDPLRYRGQVEADFDTADPDFLNGTLQIVHSSIAYNNDVYHLDSILMRAEATDSLKLINLESEFLRAHMIGRYKLTELAAAVQDALGTYYSPIKPDTVLAYGDQNVEFSAEVIRSPIVRKFLPELTEMESITLDGTFISADRAINMRLGAPHILYDGTLIDTVSLDINTVDSVLYYAGNIGTIQISNINLINTLLSGTVHDNVVDAGLWIKDSVDREQYHIGAQLFAEATDYRFQLKPDGLILNYDQWAIDPNNALYFGEEGMLARDFNLSNNNQRLSLQSQDSVKNAPIDARFSNFKIETFTKFIESSTLKLGGALNGNVLVDRLESSPVFVSDVTINQFYFDQDTIGDIHVQVDNKQANTFAANVDITGHGNDVNLNGQYVSPPDTASYFDLDLNVRNLNMSTLEAFSFGSIRETAGAIKGNLDITGTTDRPRVNGTLLFDGAAMTISMLNAHFTMDQQQIVFDNRGIKLNNFSIVDSAGNKATLNGSLLTDTYTDYRFNLNLAARNLQVLNSTAKDNELFYGDLFLDTDMKITGDLDNPKVNGDLRVNAKTDMTIVIPDDNPGLVEREGIVEFIDMSDTTSMQYVSAKDTINTNTVPGMDVSLNVNIDPDAAFTIVIDPGSGDALYAKGKGELTAGIDPGGNVSLVGTYEVSEGSYELSFNMINRRFAFQKGSTITWAGDPLTADLNITAIHTVSAPPIDLVEHQLSGQNSNLFKEKIPFDVNLFIRGEMMKPELSFGIELEEENASVSQDVSSLVETRLTQLKENESELNKQVFALIVLGRFVAENPFSSAAGGGVESMARESVSKLLSSQLNRLAGDLIAGVELDFDLQSTDDYSTGQQQARTDLNVGISKRLLDDRLKITVGSNFGIEGANQPGRQATNIAGDISAEYQLSKDGRYLLRAYRKNKYEVTLQGQVVETGLGFVINMDYNKFKELFMNARRLEQYQQEEEKRKEESYRRKGRQRRFSNDNGRDSTQNRQSDGVIQFRKEEERDED